MRVFIDTSAFIALLVSSEQWHEACKKKYRGYTDKNALFFTNILVLSELYTRLIYDVGKRDCEKVVKQINKLKEEDKLRIFQLDPALLKETEKVMLRFGEYKLSFADASIIAIAKAYDMDEIFTLDKDFRKVGLQDAGIAN